MNRQTTKISLEILLLNELLSTNAIDKDTYDKAVQKLVSSKKLEQAA